ncbi:hypothetical protein B0H66DRAFT_623615 [Apodospora peruviana]|uniref:Uncharacterized protein n=1 Tax=Apodospora peruviana TaxID=516989 RepID=A0AAE0I627_9PEZI|nr:hypothetical protein B0H66DRAFT_623615 [Apodospora peruviana]
MADLLSTSSVPPDTMQTLLSRSLDLVGSECSDKMMGVELTSEQTEKQLVEYEDKPKDLSQCNHRLERRLDEVVKESEGPSGASTVSGVNSQATDMASPRENVSGKHEGHGADIVICATAAHFIGPDGMAKSMTTMLKPGGTMAVFSYWMPSFPCLSTRSRTHWPA